MPYPNAILPSVFAITMTLKQIWVFAANARVYQPVVGMQQQRSGCGNLDETMAPRFSIGKSAGRAALRVVFAVLGKLPDAPALKLSEWLGAAAGTLVRKWSAIADQNLKIAFPEMERRARVRIRRAMFRHLGRILLTIGRAGAIERKDLPRWIVFKNLHHFTNAAKQGKGVLLLTAHLGNWELSALAHGMEIGPIHIMVRPIEDPVIDRIVGNSRIASGNKIIPKENAARAVLQALRRNEAVGILSDQNTAASEAVFVDFFGKPAAANKGFVQLAMRSGAAVIPGFACWNPRESRYVLEYYPAVDMVATGDSEADILENTRRCQAVIEKAVREDPEQWLWIHRRWKTRPPGEKPVYG